MSRADRTARGREAASVLILMGTYDGARYLGEQVASIQVQTFQDWRLLVRDDGSRDGTAEMLDALSRRDRRIEIVPGTDRNLGCTANYAELAGVGLEREPRYAMFADQDDVWHPRKIEISLGQMRAAEERRGQHCPVLVHTDLEVVDEELGPVAGSFMDFQRIRHEPREPLRVLLVQNFVAGCTTLVNRALLKLAVPIPAEVPMYDWWLALCAAAAGEISFHPAKTVRYRQHGENAVGARAYSRRWNPLRTSWPTLWKMARWGYPRTAAQAALLQQRLSAAGLGDCSGARVAAEYARLHQAGVGRWGRLHGALRLGIRRQDLLTTTLLYLRLLIAVPRLDPQRHDRG